MSERTNSERFDWLDVNLVNGWRIEGSTQCYGTVGAIRLKGPDGMATNTYVDLADAVDAAIAGDTGNQNIQGTPYDEKNGRCQKMRDPRFATAPYQLCNKHTFDGHYLCPDCGGPNADNVSTQCWGNSRHPHAYPIFCGSPTFGGSSRCPDCGGPRR